MKIKNIAAGDFVQIKNSMCHSEFKAKQVCEVIDIDPTDKYGFDVLTQGKNCLDWVNHKHLKKSIKREPEPQLKQLDQSVFDGEPEQIKWAVVTIEGAVLKFELEPVVKDGLWYWTHSNGCRQHSLIGQYDASNWQNSLIERDTTKELTGSELCKAMLERGDKFVVCKLADTSEADAISNSMAKLVTEYDGDGFYHELADSYWYFAVPINNQGEPLTAAEAGL